MMYCPHCKKRTEHTSDMWHWVCLICQNWHL